MAFTARGAGTTSEERTSEFRWRAFQVLAGFDRCVRAALFRRSAHHVDVYLMRGSVVR